ncbi:hypothetical protein H5200_13700 [Pseudoalteromonas sp. SG43-7]|uniref:hypothetical protein n=1 Tax=Pseudoalteromonas TaxID=53246 RepID=UPI001230AEEB|nr:MULTISPECIES: hypothetical protein [Pseudoalteromonas]MBB1335165.1 hypothetical protein [Pseudoalteromonas sp. SR41-6]MBB1419092.1 hypothetical protein [Pseudoalteromonas sp. SG44-1]MBB1422958.1 hypothetical protein [Pseudoalteromonas sp. SG43-7]MBB1460625.1 hypothetical protein [Pseudoalteromonas sp. SG41-8]MBB1468384.1 hypothetical protein [Pseudoalteromonas sp. SG41-5]
MSIVNMFRKEALRNQYKSSDIGKSLIKQPKIINNSISALIAIFVFSFLVINVLTLSTKRSLDAKVSSEHYTPLIYNEVVVINKHFAIDGESVKKNQQLLTISKFDSNSKLEKEVIRSPSDGLFFHSLIEKNIIQPFEPLGYVLSTTSENELSFWISSNKNMSINVKDKITLIVNNDELKGIVTMVIGSNKNNKEQKIHLKLETNNYSKLSPNADIKILLTQQSEKALNLIK